MIEIQEGLITLHTAHTTYQMLADADGILRHLYYGARLPLGVSAAEDRPVHPWDKGCWPNLLPLEFAAPGTGDHRLPAVLPAYPDGTEAADLRFAGAEQRAGKYTLGELPAFTAEPGQPAETLAVTLRDARAGGGLAVTLLYGVLPDCDLITRTAVFANESAAPLTLHTALSLCLDFPARPLELLTLNGDWASERTPERAPLRQGVQSVGSTQGITGHGHSNAVALCAPGADETAGDCWGFALVYSGNFLARAEAGAAGARLTMGIHPYHFHWTLAPGETFTAPEAAMVFSDRGLGEMSRRFHRAIRGHLLPRRWRDAAAPRPVLLNSWEACYFAFDEARLLSLAGAARKAGIDLFVLDDGWFRGRNDDTTSLGDWTCDYRKLPGGIPGLCQKINALGMAFGIWVEPEAVSPDSALYRAHPDWALEMPGRATLPVRHQYTLDFSRSDVRDGIWNQLTALLDSCPIRYLKWDMNRSLADVYSAALPAARQGEVYHRYVLGVYDLQRRLTERYPDLLLENCAGGGARFDCGMLAFSPQIWCSDNTDALSRLTIQYGTTLFYPPCTMGAHFSTVPNHITGRAASPEARMAAALSGTFGFELDLTGYTDEMLAALAPSIRWYRAHGALLRSGELYRLRNPGPALRGAAWMVAAANGAEAAVFASGDALNGDGGLTPRLRLQGLDPAAVYADEAGNRYPGAALLAAGLPLPGARGEMPACLWYLKRI